MTPKFDALITEILTAANKRVKSRYSEPGQGGLSGDVRAHRNLANKSSSQRSKLGNQQYIGSGVATVRRRNRSKKSADKVSIAKGLGGHMRIDGVNPKEIGAVVNSKQGNMEIKAAMPNGTYKIGPKHSTDFDYMEKPHADRFGIK
jgi:hypothetical protein